MSDYKEYIDTWLGGIIDEIHFWEDYVFSPTGINHEDYMERRVKNTCFRLEEDLSKLIGDSDENIKILDVGSGPCSRCGYKSNKYDLDVIAVDPLAEIYNMLRERYHINSEIKIETGFVELLDKKFREESFDFVHMSNALDHAFDALYGLYELLYVCKIGGAVILRHHENEAENENYEGFHQWNLSVHNNEESFIIWRDNVRYNVCELLKDVVDISIFPDLIEEESGWHYNKIILQKKKKIKLPTYHYYDIFTQSVYNYLLSVMLKENEKRNTYGIQDAFSRKIRERIMQIRNNPEWIHQMTSNKGIKNIDIYGAGKIGRDLYTLCIESGIKVGTIIDKNVNKVGLLPVTLLKDYDSGEGMPVVVTTVSQDAICDIHKKNIKMIPVDEFLMI